MTEKVLITSALLYANGPLHFGHIAGAYLPADVYARFERQQGKEVLYISGSDEYGMPITLSAEQEGRTPQEHVDKYHALNRELFERLDFSFDHFGRTSWPKHHELVDEYFTDLKSNGYVEERLTKQLYSEEDERFLADRYVTGTCPRCGAENARGDECPSCGGSYEATDLKDPRSKVSGSPLALRETRHWFLLLDKLQPKLSEWMAQKQWRSTVLNFAKHYLKDLHPRAITRDASWGIPVSDGKVFYVWFEAPIGYLSIARQWSDKWRDFWCDPKTRLVHFIGKDNIFFHALFFPAMTMGQNQPYKLVDDLPANEFLLLEGRQFSKSEGWFIDLSAFLDVFSADQVRYVLAANAPETGDSEFTFDDFQQRCNSELVGKYGNLANRVLVFAERKGVTEPSALGPADEVFLADIAFLTDEIHAAYRGYHLRRACQLIMDLAARGNVYFDHKQPWKADDFANTIHCSLQGLRALAQASAPVMPSTAKRLEAMLEGAPLEPLFARVEDEQLSQFRLQ